MHRKGRCLCGQVSFTAIEASSSVSACHCRMCRRWGGGPYMEIECNDGVEFDGSENISIFASSEWAERGFCKHCGSHLFYRLKGSSNHMMAVGTFDDDHDLRFDKQVFIDERPEYYEFANRTENMTGAELFAKYSPDS